MSTDLHTLSGAFALNALSGEEAEEFRRHLEDCAACRQEVRELQETAAAMAASESVPPPAYLKDRVLAAADRTPQLPPRAGGGTVIPVAPRRWGRRTLLAAAAVALVVAAGIGIHEVSDEDQHLAAGVVRVFDAADAHTAEVPTDNGGRIRVAASPGLNQMAVDTDELPPLDDGRVYQLWAIRGGTISSVGVLEPDRGVAMEMPPADTQVAITVEPAGGSEQPTSEPITAVEVGQL
jgi:anti-sigma-K factor RskA